MGSRDARSETFLHIFPIHVKLCTATYFSADLPLSSMLSSFSQLASNTLLTLANLPF